MTSHWFRVKIEDNGDILIAETDESGNMLEELRGPTLEEYDALEGKVGALEVDRDVG